jgi:hypothetical protein
MITYSFEGINGKYRNPKWRSLSLIASYIHPQTW